MSENHYLRFDDITVSLLSLQVWVRETKIHFTLCELRVLLVFLAEPHRTISGQELVERADLTSVNALRTLIARLRNLLGPQYIFTCRRGLGYSFTTPHCHSDTWLKGE